MKGIGGDWAETAFEEYAKKKDISFERYGFDRSELKNFRYLPEFVRLTPDFAATKKSKGFLVECKGCGRGDVVNVKLRDIDTLSAWNVLAPIYIFVNDSSQDRVSFMPFDEFITAIVYTEIGSWDDGARYYKIPKINLEWEDKDDL
jgi:hypothetical protein